MIAAKEKKVEKKAETELEPETKEKPETKEGKEFTFLCKFCGQSKSVDEMRVLSRFSPPLIACRECEKALR